jgi:glycosyltransferase involved in cell wall biosynthesis
VEYPSFRHHQWDPKYPPMDGQRYTDKFDEMLNYFAAVKSDLVITPSRYAKRMFPAMMQDKVTAQMDAFNPRLIESHDPDKVAFKKEPGRIYVGFAANVLSSEKGLEQFVATSKKLSALNPNIRYVLIGDAKGPGYCYEYIFLEQRFGKNSPVTFRDYLFSKYGVNESLYTSVGRLDAQSLSATINAVDFFLYPLQFGSANWGIYELLLRGKIVIASNRCFLPEVIAHGENGFLLDYDDTDAWAKLADAIARDLEAYQAIGRKAADMGGKYHMENTAEDYLGILMQVVEKRKKAA